MILALQKVDCAFLEFCLDFTDALNASNYRTGDFFPEELAVSQHQENVLLLETNRYNLLFELVGPVKAIFDQHFNVVFWAVLCTALRKA